MTGQTDSTVSPPHSDPADVEGKHLPGPPETMHVAGPERTKTRKKSRARRKKQVKEPIDGGLAD